MQADARAVESDRGQILEGEILVAAARPHARLFNVGKLEVGGRAQMHFAGDAVDDDRVAVFHGFRNVSDVADQGTPSARATMAMCEAAPASSSTTPRSRERS